MATKRYSIFFNAPGQKTVVYWPTTRPGCKNRKCTCVNNRCIRSRNIRIITLTMDRLNECEIVTSTRRRCALNYYITVHRKFNQLEIRCSRESQLSERLGPQAPGWAAQENGKEMRLWPIEWGSICCSCVRFPTPSHTQPFQIKWEVYFSKNCVARLYCVVCVLYADVYVLSIQQLTIWLVCFICRTFVGGVILRLCRDAVGVFYIPNHLGCMVSCSLI